MGLRIFSLAHVFFYEDNITRDLGFLESEIVVHGRSELIAFVLSAEFEPRGGSRSKPLTSSISVLYVRALLSASPKILIPRQNRYV